jgi:hypothetical protein
MPDQGCDALASHRPMDRPWGKGKENIQMEIIGILLLLALFVGLPALIFWRLKGMRQRNLHLKDLQLRDLEARERERREG